MDVGSLFIADPQPAELVEPCEGPLHYPSPPPEPAAAVRVTLCQQQIDAFCMQACPNLLAATVAKANQSEL